MFKFANKESGMLVEQNGQELLTWSETDRDNPIMVHKGIDACDK